MLPNPYSLERLVAERHEELLRAAQQARLAKEARPQVARAPRPSARTRLAEMLRGIADRLEPVPARAC